MAVTDADAEKLINEYTNGMSLNAIARKYGTYPTSIKRILVNHNIEIRDDTIKKGTVLVNDGDKLIKWAKAQDRLVTRAELAEVLGKTRISNSYFIQYPELGKYVKPYKQDCISSYIYKLYDWLKANDIPYLPNSRVKLGGAPVHATLLNEYNGILIHIAIKPKTMSKANFTTSMDNKKKRAEKNGCRIIFLLESDFKDLDYLKKLLEKKKK